jgi:hypothetical protein
MDKKGGRFYHFPETGTAICVCSTIVTQTTEGQRMSNNVFPSDE